MLTWHYKLRTFCPVYAVASLWCGTVGSTSLHCRCKQCCECVACRTLHAHCCTLYRMCCLLYFVCCFSAAALCCRCCRPCRSALTAHELVSVDSDAVTTEYRCDRRVQSSCSCLRRLRLPRLIAPTLRTSMAVLPSNRRAKLSRRRRAKAKANRRSGRAIAYMVHHP